MHIHNFKVGTNVFVSFETQGTERFILATVLFVDGNNLSVHFPEEDFEMKDIPHNTTLKVRYAGDGKAIGWSITDWYVADKEQIPYLTMHSIEEAQSLNEREAYRVLLMIPSSAYVEHNSIFDITIKDISQTGIGFLSRNKLNIGDVINISVNDSQNRFSIYVKIVRSRSTEKYNEYIYGAELYGFSNPKLNAFVQQKQLEELRRRKSKII